MTFDSPLQGAQNVVIDTLMRGMQSQHLINDLVSRYINSDFLSRDENLRLSGARCASYLSGLDGRDRRAEELLCDDVIRRVNMIAQLTNNQVTIRMAYAEIHPKMTSNDCYPREFERPCRVEEILNADNTLLDRLLSAYNLPRTYNMSSYASTAFRNVTSYFNGTNSNYSSDRGSNLSVLLEYLGVSLADEHGREIGTVVSLGLGRSRPSDGDNLRLGNGGHGRRALGLQFLFVQGRLVWKHIMDAGSIMTEHLFLPSRNHRSNA